MLTQRQHQAHSFICERMQATKVAPTFSEMMNHLRLASKSSIHRLMQGLEQRGYIARIPHRDRAIEVLRLPDGTPVGATALLRALDRFMLGDIDEVELHDIWQEYRPPRRRAA